MTVVDMSNTFGNFSNHLYFSLMMRRLEEQSGGEFRYVRNGDFTRFGLEPRLARFGVARYSVDRWSVPPGSALVRNVPQIPQAYHQAFNVDFTLEQLERFIRDVILRSDAYVGTVADGRPGRCAVHVRCGDYVGSRYDCFDRTAYLEKALARVSPAAATAKVFSDDPALAESQLGPVLSARFGEVEYSRGASAEEDFVEMSLFRDKVLWNSTFSYWAAFVGNVLYPGSYECVVAPSEFDGQEPSCNHLNPLWRIVYVKS